MKKSWIAVLLSLILPGIGHLYLEQYKKGFILLSAYIVSLILTSVIIGVFLWFGIWIYSIVNSYKTCNLINNEDMSMN